MTKITLTVKYDTDVLQDAIIRFTKGGEYGDGQAGGLDEKDVADLLKMIDKILRKDD